jgi:serine/threonine-protein kinase
VRLEIDAQDEMPAPPPVARNRHKLLWLSWTAAGIMAATLIWLPGWRARPQSLTTDVLRLRTELGGQVPLAPFNVQFGDSTVISPAGDAIAFVGQASPDSSPELFVRPLNQLLAMRLPGTDNAIQPFFSPDGEWIGFFADAKLKKVSAHGGPVVTLAAAPSARGGSWSDDGTIVFSPHQTPGTQLMRVAAGGGDAEPWGSLADGEAIQISPQVLRGGAAVLYTSSRIAGSFNQADLVIEVVPQGAKKIIQRDAYHGRYLTSGHLVYVHDGTLFAAPFDLNRLEVTGPAVPAIDEVISNAITGGAQFSVSNTGTLAYLPGKGIGAGTPLHWMERSGNTSPLRAWSANWFNLAFAPDGRHVAMEIRERTSDIWSYDWARDTLTQLTRDPSRATNPVWTPDGRRITFASSRADKSAANLYWQDVDSKDEPQRLTTSVNQQYPSSWHPSGAFLAFEETSPPLNVDVMILPFQGSPATGWKAGQPYVFINSPFIEGQPMFSPDGKWLAYVSKESGRGEIYVRPFPGPGPKWQISTAGGNLPTWSHTKPELFFGANGRIMTTTFTVEGGTFRAEEPRLWSEGRYQTRGENRMFDLHPDGERFALAPAPQLKDSAKQDHVFLILNYFDELRRVAGR